MANLPRKLPADISFDEAEDECIFTRSALLADPDAKDLAGETDDWMPYVDNARAADRTARMARGEADAERVVANRRFDGACTGFGDELYIAVNKDRASTRWLMFFSVPVNRFVRQALDKQIQKVQGWLSGSQDAVLNQHRANLTQWMSASDTAINKQKAAAMKQGEAKLAREEMADALTRERDGLYELLSARAREKNLPREWPSQFYRIVRRKEEEESAGEAAGGEGKVG